MHSSKRILNKVVRQGSGLNVDKKLYVEMIVNNNRQVTAGYR